MGSALLTLQITINGMFVSAAHAIVSQGVFLQTPGRLSPTPAAAAWSPRMARIVTKGSAPLEYRFMISDLRCLYLVLMQERIV